MKANTEHAENLETQIALYNEEPGTMTRGSSFPIGKRALGFAYLAGFGNRARGSR
jgi:hypothetical protein